MGVYAAHTSGVSVSDNATVRLDSDNDPQPDVHLRLDDGGNTSTSADGYVEGAPELIVEIAATSASYDMHAKKLVYARNGVCKSIVALTYEQKLHWFVLREGEYEELWPGVDGILRSEAFPGLWLQLTALWQPDLASLLTMLQQGVATPEHARFVQQLNNKDAKDR